MKTMFLSSAIFECEEESIEDLADIGVLPCASCDYLCDTETHDYCPRCGRKFSDE